MLEWKILKFVKMASLETLYCSSTPKVQFLNKHKTSALTHTNNWESGELPDFEKTLLKQAC